MLSRDKSCTVVCFDHSWPPKEVVVGDRNGIKTKARIRSWINEKKRETFEVSRSALLVIIKYII